MHDNSLTYFSKDFHRLKKRKMHVLALVFSVGTINLLCNNTISADITVKMTTATIMPLYLQPSKQSGFKSAFMSRE